MNKDKDICAVCAWREDCRKKFSVSGRDVHCADFSRDMRIKADNTEETGKGELSKRENNNN
jgi:hypothetical protein